MTTIEEARQRWPKDQPAFRQFGQYLTNKLRQEIRRRGIAAEVSSRPKDIDSIIKKLIKKSSYTYETLGDKAGVRVIVRHKDEIAPVLEIPNDLFRRGELENTSDRLEPNAFGYLSVHSDVRLLPNDPRIQEFPSEYFFAELQVRTLAQYLWAEMTHDSIYKHDSLLTPLTWTG